jgi:membrane protein implicated in regulation of membrane protease activity
MNRINPRLVIAVIASFLDEVLLVVAVLWVLPKLGVAVPLWLVVILAVVFLASGALTFVVVRKKPNLGFESQIGTKAIAVSKIGNKGLVRIGHENWAARTDGPAIEQGTPIVVVGQNALILLVVPDDSV